MSKSLSSLYAALGLSALLAALNLLAYEYYFYWVYWWYDVMMHFLAGFALGFLVYWVLNRLVKGEKSRAFILAWTVACVFALGFVWEVFEYVNGLTDSHETYIQDTINDLILDSCGGALAVLIASSRRKRTTHG